MDKPEEMARKAVEQAFAKFDKDHNDKLSFEEFKQWFDSDVF